jgi:hypothetical protein
MAIMLADGFEDAIVGLGQQFTNEFVVYDRSKCIEILMYRDGMTEEEAEEYFEVNVVGAWVGKGTPVFVRQMVPEDVLEHVQEFGE